MELLHEFDSPEIPPTGILPASGECHLWRIAIRSHSDWYDLLSQTEKVEAERFLVKQAHSIFVTSRAVQRLIGAHYLGVSPQSVRILRTCANCGGAHGRPRYLDTTADYSVSHTNDWMVLALVGNGRVGVDIENVLTVRREEDLSRTVLTANEQELLIGVSKDERVAAYLRFWTRKEAVVKLTGQGLLAPLNQIDVAEAEVLTSSPLAGWPSPIHLHDIAVSDHHVASLAVDHPLRITVICGPIVQA